MLRRQRTVEELRAVQVRGGAGWGSLGKECAGWGGIKRGTVEELWAMQVGAKWGLGVGRCEVAWSRVRVGTLPPPASTSPHPTPPLFLSTGEAGCY